MHQAVRKGLPFYLHPMNPRPLTMPSAQRELLLELERLHEEWRLACAAADAIDCSAASAESQKEVQRLLEYRLEADRAHQRVMKLLRETPI